MNKHYALALAALVVAIGTVAVAKPKHHLGVTISAGATGQPGQLPSAVYAPAINGPANVFIYDGGPGPIPPVQDSPLFASAIFIGGSAGQPGYGIVTAISGLDGGPPPGLLFEEVGSVISGGGAVAINTQRPFSPWDGGVGLASASCACTPMLCVGLGGCYATACNMTTDGGQSQVNITSDGGLWRYDCLGY